MRTPAQDPVTPDMQAIEGRIELLSRLISAHGGRLELASSDGAGALKVRFGGLCSACELRPLTFAKLIEPVLLGVAGVRSVAIDGYRISDQARQRLSGTTPDRERMSRSSARPDRPSHP